MEPAAGYRKWLNAHQDRDSVSFGEPAAWE